MGKKTFFLDGQKLANLLQIDIHICQEVMMKNFLFLILLSLFFTSCGSLKVNSFKSSNKELFKKKVEVLFKKNIKEEGKWKKFKGMVNSGKMKIEWQSSKGSLWDSKLKNQVNQIMNLVGNGKEEADKVCDCLDGKLLLNINKEYPTAKLVITYIKDMISLKQIKEPSSRSMGKLVEPYVDIFGTEFFDNLSTKDESVLRWTFVARNYFHIPNNKLKTAFTILKNYKERGGMRIRTEYFNEWVEINLFSKTIPFHDFNILESCVFDECPSGKSNIYSKYSKNQRNLFLLSLAMYDWKVVSSTLFSNGFQLNQKTANYMRKVMKRHFKKKIRKARKI